MGEIGVTPADLEEQGAIWVSNACDFHGSVLGARDNLQAGAQALTHPAAQAAMQAFCDRLHQTCLAIAQTKTAIGNHLIASARGYQGTDQSNARGLGGGQ